jgi:outer membrane receptor protein involved in Fe transport
VGRIRSRGIELEATYRPRASWLFSGSYTFDEAILSESDDPGLVGKRVRQAPRHQFVLRTSFDRPSILSTSIQARYVGKRFEDDVNTLPMDELFVVDAMVSRGVARWAEVFISAENIFDSEFEVRTTNTGLVELGAPRLVQGGVRLSF